jgi:hypothetical protein
MLGGYLIAIYADKAKAAAFSPKWIAIGAAGLIVMLFMSLDIFRGQARSPHSGTTYISPYTKLPERRNGYTQKWAEVAARRRPGSGVAGWEAVGQYIQANSTPDDGIYVWGWFPGIYVQAQRMSPAPKAFEGTMHTLAPEVLSERVAEILDSFEKQPPKYLVDSYKRHFPWDRPPLELWPKSSSGFLPTNEQVVSQYEAMYARMLREKVDDPAEEKRFEAMKPFRDYVMGNYRVVRSFGQQVLFQRK